MEKIYLSSYIILIILKLTNLLNISWFVIFISPIVIFAFMFVLMVMSFVISDMLQYIAKKIGDENDKKTF